MENEKSVRARLIQAGIVELEEHGLRDFSLRRVAQGAEVSCAAPYRHFRDKEELILAIISYIRESWELLAAGIRAAHSEDTRATVLALALASLRFWLANGNLRSVLMSGEDELDAAKRAEVNRFDAPVVGAVREHAYKANVADAEELAFTVLALIYGTVTLVSSGSVSAADGAARLGDRVADLL